MRRISRTALVLLGLITVGALPTACSTTSDLSAARSALDGWNAEAISDATQTSHFGGFDVSLAQRTVTVYRTAAVTSDDMSTVDGINLPAGFSLRTKEVQRSWTALEHLEETLPSRLPPHLRARLGEVGIDARANGLDVGLTRIEPDSRAELKAVLGAALATVHRADRATTD